ncbi:male sterility protein-domain-containing protein [Aspergillus multicolor]|uniref:male sterility protein-domain-containing protein n=1 Tax=Aspergillus multicolor TaxID=41759 RepID=UPI003CCD02D1
MHPTVNKLSTLLHSFLYGSDKGQRPRSDIINGSTGSLGCYLLDKLRTDESVRKVYCLTRDSDVKRQQKLLQERGLDFTIPDKIEFIQTSSGAPQLGIKDAKFQEMLQSVDTIIHNAWRMDFNISVESFDDIHIRAVRSLLDFSLQSTKRAHVHFLSSIGAVGRATGSAVPEIAFEDCDVTLRRGYGEAKHVCQRICLAASQRAGVPVSVHRLGQIAGPCTGSGYWNPIEWLPAIVATSKFLGKMPSTLGAFPVDWIPVDSLATIIVEILHSCQREDTFKVFHQVNPTPPTWESLLRPIHNMYPGMNTVLMEQWVEDLKLIQAPTARELASKPALKLLGFYEGLIGSVENGVGSLSVPLDTTNIKGASATMQSLSSITPEMLSNWLQQWAF